MDDRFLIGMFFVAAAIVLVDYTRVGRLWGGWMFRRNMKRIQSKKYILHPGYIVSPYDRQRHYISYYQLMRLYGLNPKECVNGSRPEELAGLHQSKLIHLHPRRNGNYAKPRRS